VLSCHQDIIGGTYGVTNVSPSLPVELGVVLRGAPSLTLAALLQLRGPQEPI